MARAGAGGGAARAKNRNPAPVQITAEQLLREAREGGDPELLPPPRRTIADPEEFAEHRHRRRGEFEYAATATATATIASTGCGSGTRRWRSGSSATSPPPAGSSSAGPRGAPRARPPGWPTPASSSGTGRPPAPAPSTSSSCRSGPWPRRSWRTRGVRERCRREAARARAVHESAVAVVDPEVDEGAELLLLSFAKLEETALREPDRARAVYIYGLGRLPEGRTAELRRGFLAFDRQYGGHAGETEDAAAAQRRLQYEHAVAGEPLDYNLWFEYLRLEEGIGDVDRVRAVYERAVANVPPAEEKRYWRRYIYLWIARALYEELDAQDMEKARAVYRDCLRLIPHAKFSFSKVWIMAAQFEIRQKNLAAARRTLGNAIGVAPKEKIFSKYIGMELRLGCVARARILCEKFIEWAPGNSRAWLTYAELEKSLGETERERAIRQLAMDFVETKAAKGFKRKRPAPCVPSNAKMLEAAYSWKTQRVV